MSLDDGPGPARGPGGPGAVDLEEDLEVDVQVRIGRELTSPGNRRVGVFANPGHQDAVLGLPANERAVSLGQGVGNKPDASRAAGRSPSSKTTLLVVVCERVCTRY